MRHSCIITTFLSFFILQSVAQDPPQDIEIQKIIPPTPNAASLGNYGNIPIGLYTGQPNISFPLYEISYNDFSVPISLSYNYSGLKVEEYPSWVGTGWTLTGTGVISRQVRGLADETTSGYNGSERSGEKVIDYIANGNYNSTIDNFLHGIIGGDKDSEPDLFVLSLPGHSAKFFFDETQCSATTKQATIIPHQKLKIIGYFNYTGIYNIRPGIIEKFEVTDERGVKYTFDVTEKAAGVEPGDPDEGDFASSWYLSKIETPNQNEITYEYTDRILDMPPTVFERRDIPIIDGGGTHVNPFDTHTIEYSHTSTNEKILTRILFRDGIVDFVEGDERLDWNSTLWSPLNNATEQPRPLAKLKVTVGGKQIKQIDFNYSYFGTEARLRLDSFQERNGQESKKPYMFSYRNGTFPAIGQSSSLFHQDHWGYYIGSTINGEPINTLIPTFSKSFDAPDGTLLVVNVPGNDRVPNSAYSANGILEEITYPTGGSTKFEYEANEYWGSPEFNLCAGEFQPSENAKVSFSFGDQTETKEFTVLTPTCMKVHYNLSAPCLDGEAGVKIEFGGSLFLQHIVSNMQWGMDYSNFGPEDGELFTLQPGTYTMTAWGINENTCGQLTTSEITFYQISQITNCDGEFDEINNISLSFLEGIQSESQQLTLTETLCMKVQYLINPQCNDSEAGVKIVHSSGAEIMNHSITISAGTTSNSNYGPQNNETFTLIPGSYTVTAWGYNDNLCEQLVISEIIVQQNIDNPLGFANLKAGGLRVKSVNDCDVDQTCTKRNYLYHDVDKPGRSSGILINGPSYFYLQNVMFDQNETPTYIGTSHSSIPIASTNGGVLGYRHITVKEELDDSRGHSIYKFSTAVEHPDEGIEEYPFPPRISNDWKRGKQLFQKDFSQTQILSNQSAVFCEVPSYDRQIAIKVKKLLDYRSGNGYFPSIFDFDFIPYSLKSGIFNLCQEQQTTYSYQNSVQQALSIQKEFFYENPAHLQVTRIESTNSKGDEKKSIIKYVEDVAAVAGLTQTEQLGISSHKNKMAVIEQQEFSGPNLLSTKRNLFEDQKLIKVQFSTGANPLEDYVNYNAYDDYNNVLNYTTWTGENKSYLWDNNGTYPLAEAVNANYTDIFFTSFETTGESFVDANGSNKSVSGTKVLGAGTFNFPANFQPTDPPNTLMSYWYWQNNQWNFSGEIPYVNSIVTSASKLDEIRAFPKGAQMTTLTFDPGVGATGVTDPNNLSMHYEYDQLGRLVLIRDHEGNILQEYKYHYSEQN